MLIQGMLQQALTDLFSRNMLNHGPLFFDRLRRLEICPPEEVDQLEATWLELVKERQKESAGSTQALKDFSSTLADLLEKNVGQFSARFNSAPASQPATQTDEEP
jgi:hypothetical protein